MHSNGTHRGLQWDSNRTSIGLYWTVYTVGAYPFPGVVEYMY